MTISDRIKDLLKKTLHFGKLNHAAQMVKTFVEVNVHEKPGHAPAPPFSPPEPETIGTPAVESNPAVGSVPTFDLPQPAPHPGVYEQKALGNSAAEIDFGRQGDLESYARGLRVSAGTIEEWLSAGILCPDETRVAEKLLKILRNRDHHQTDRAALS